MRACLRVCLLAGLDDVARRTEEEKGEGNFFHLSRRTFKESDGLRLRPDSVVAFTREDVCQTRCLRNWTASPLLGPTSSPRITFDVPAQPAWPNKFVMPRSFLIKKHHNVGAALTRPAAAVKRPWLDENSVEAEDLSTSPPPVVRTLVALSPALSDGCVPGRQRSALFVLRQFHFCYRFCSVSSAGLHVENSVKFDCTEVDATVLSFARLGGVQLVSFIMHVFSSMLYHECGSLAGVFFYLV